LIEVGGLIFVIYSAWSSFGKVEYFELPPHGIQGIFIGAALSFFAFTGFEDSVKLAEETKDPEKNMPKALFISTAIVSALYLLVVIAAVSAVPYAELAESKSPLSMIAQSQFGKSGALIIAVIALFSTANSLLSNMLGASRVTYAMAKETGNKLFSRISEKRKTPVIALIAVSIIMAVFSLIGNIKTIALTANFFVLSTFVIINISVIYFRIKDPGQERPFKIPLNFKNIPVISVLAILMTLTLIFFAVKGLVS
jgi:APA family basic amino acid/polyamine antiporter